MPVTSLKLDYKSSMEIISTGLPALDKLFNGGGIYKGSSVLLTGTAGTAKIIVASHFALSSCLRNEPVLYFSFEESPDQLIRNMAPIGIDLNTQVKSGLLHIHVSRPSLQSLEKHLLSVHKKITEVNPGTVIIDPISSLLTVGSGSEVRAMLVRLMDFLKVNQVNSMCTSLTHNKQGVHEDATVDAVSSLADTWISLCNEVNHGETMRTLNIVKSRGRGHYTNPQRFIITDDGIVFKHKQDKQLTNIS